MSISFIGMSSLRELGQVLVAMGSLYKHLDIVLLSTAQSN